MTSRSRSREQAINASSMADIAFLLLIFFLVTTTIMQDKGVLVRLPPYEEDPPPTTFLDRNVLRVALNADDALLVDNRPAQVAELRERVREFVLNPRQREDLALRPTQAVVSLIHDRSTTYGTYIQVYNELKGAYSEMWESEALRRYGRTFSALSPAEQRAVRQHIPLIISEADPYDLGQKE